MFPIDKPFCRIYFRYAVICAALVLPAFEASALIEITGVTHTYSQYCDGSIEVTAAGNGGPFTIAWGQAGNQQVNNINGSYTIANLCPNANYSITVTNQYGCPKILGAYISLCNSYPAYTITQNAIVHSTAPGDNQGSVDISVAVTGYPYTPQLYYKWTDQQGNVVATTQDLQHVGAGIYCVEVTSGCGQASKCFEVKDCTCPCPVGIEFDMNFKCSPGINKGTLGARAISEFPPLTYQWSGPDGFSSAEQTLHSVGEGNYCVTVTDKCGRTNTRCQKMKCCDAYEMPTIQTDYECLGWEDFLGFWHEHDGHMEVDLTPYYYTQSPECNAQFTLKWSVDNSENTVAFNTATNSWEGNTVKHIPSPGNYCVTVTNNCGCSRKSCRTFGAMGHYSGFDARRLDAFLWQNVPGYTIGDFYDEQYLVLLGCEQCNACGMDGFTNVVGGPCDEAGSGQQDLFTYTDPNPYDDKPCSGGAINCFNNPPNPLNPWTIPDGLEGIEIVEEDAPQTIFVEGQAKCVYPVWCLFPHGSIDNFPASLPVLVKHPVGKIIEPGENSPCNPTPPANAECPGGFVTNDGVGEDCLLRWYCSSTGQVVRTDEIYLSQVVICECYMPVPGGSSNCITIKRCELNYQEKGDPDLCGGFEILYSHCEEQYNNCQVAAAPPPEDNIESGGDDRNNKPEIIRQPGIRVYPNPFSGAVRIDFNNVEPILSGLVQVEFRDITGRAVAAFQQDATGSGIFSMEMDLGQSAIPPGTYTMSVKCGSGVFASFLLIKTK